MSASPPEAPSAVDRLERDALVAGEAATGALRAIEVGAIVLLGLLVCPPLAILLVVVGLPLLVVAVAVALVAAVVAVAHRIVRGLERH